VRRWNVEAYAHWVSCLADNRESGAGSELLTQGQSNAEDIYLGLRTSAGLPVALEEHEHLTRWIDAGWAHIASDSRLRLTASGWLRLDALAGDLTMLRSRY
jgi:oxygen-independent coproporphyrinogen-3 oxidase